MVVLVLLAMPLNGAYYEELVNYDPQGDGQQWEWSYATHVFRHTSGILLGQVLSLVVGVALARRHPLRAALELAIPLSVALGVIGLTVALLLGGEPAAVHDFTLPWAVIAAELAAYPLVAAAGVALGALLVRRRVVNVAAVLAALLWLIMTVAGLMEYGMYAPLWLLVALPPLAAAAAISGSALSLDEWQDSANPLESDWGHTAAIALLAGLAAWCLTLHLLRRVSTRTPGS